MKFGHSVEYNMRNIFPWWRNYSETLFSKIKIELLSASIADHLPVPLVSLPHYSYDFQEKHFI